MYEFEFEGAVETIGGVGKVKFLAFVIVDGQELVLYDAQKRGLVTKFIRETDRRAILQSISPYLKVFMSFEPEGVGQRKGYYNFFLRLGSASTTRIGIRPRIGRFKDCNLPYFFEGQADFMTQEEIEEKCSENTRLFYRKQTYLTKSEISEIVTIIPVEISGEPVEVRKLRF